MKSLRTMGQIAAVLPVVVALVMLRAFAPIIAAASGPETVIAWALSLKGRLDEMERSWR